MARKMGDLLEKLMGQFEIDPSCICHSSMVMVSQLIGENSFVVVDMNLTF
jgi:hypothetical protein